MNSMMSRNHLKQPATRRTVLLLTALLGAAGAMAVPAPAFAAAASVELQADFNGDGFADLAVGSPSESLTGLAAAGVVRIFYGGPDGPGSGPIAVQTFTQADLDLSLIEDPDPRPVTDSVRRSLSATSTATLRVIW